MDVSGSMTDDQKEIVRTEAFWIDTWLKSQYDGVTTRYIIHDAVAREVDEHTFYHTRESGGTQDQLGLQAGEQDHRRASIPQADWNIYVFHFSDGDNWGEDNRHCISLLRDQLLPKCNLFCYGQVESPYGSGEFYRELEEAFEDEAQTSPSPRSVTRKESTIRSRSFWDGDAEPIEEESHRCLDRAAAPSRRDC